MTDHPDSHPAVLHPADLLADLAAERARLSRWNDALLTWMAEHVLASQLVFDAALVLPLVTLPAPDSVKITLGVVSGSWFQWWALPALQRSQVKADAARAVKADADHAALTHIATAVDDIRRAVLTDHPTGDAR